VGFQIATLWNYRWSRSIFLIKLFLGGYGVKCEYFGSKSFHSHIFGSFHLFHSPTCSRRYFVQLFLSSSYFALGYFECLIWPFYRGCWAWVVFTSAISFWVMFMLQHSRSPFRNSLKSYVEHLMYFSAWRWLVCTCWSISEAFRDS
jgi:hypothetical protein